MNTVTRFSLFGAIAVVALVAGCAGNGSSAVAPASLAPADARSNGQSVTQLLSMMHMQRPGASKAHQFKSFFSCPAKGPLKYVADYNNNVINVFAGKFAGQLACGQITSGLLAPWGLYVQPHTRDLYVANDGHHNILVFHRGALTPYNKYTDPTGEDPVDVVVAGDGTVIASNFVRTDLLQNGSLSTWTSGQHGGTFVGNFAYSAGGIGAFVTVQNNGTVYFEQYVGSTNVGHLWHVVCPRGACGTQTQDAGVEFNIPGGLASDNQDDLLANNGFGQAWTFHLPDPNPSAFPVVGIPTDLAINQFDKHWFIADGFNNQAEEYQYPSGKLIGVVYGNPGGGTFGIAVDPGHEL